MLEYIFLFPVGLVIATVAMSSGVAGSNFWIPLYLLWLGLPPRVAFWASLVTMLFGFGSGVVRNWQAGTIDGALVRGHLPWVLGAAAFGALLAPRIEVGPLLAAYAIFVGLYGAWLLASTWRTGPGEVSSAAAGPSRRLGVLAGFLQGLIATGAGALLMPSFLARRPQEPARAVGSTVLLVFLASLVAAILRLDAALWATLVEQRELIASMTGFAAAGAVVGGQLGPRVAAKLPALWLRRYVAAVLVIVGVLVARRVFGAG